MGLEENVRKWEEIVKNNPDDAEAHYQLGCVYERYGIYSGCVLINKAVEKWRRARSIDPKSAETHAPVIYGDTDERIEEYEKSLEQIPEAKEFTVATLSLLGNAYSVKGFEIRFTYSKKALDELIKAIELDQEHKDARGAHSVIVSNLRDELNMIRHNFENVQCLEGCDLNQAELHYKLGDDYFIKGDYTKAMEEYKKALFGYHKFRIENGAEKLEKMLSFPINLVKAAAKSLLVLVRGY